MITWLFQRRGLYTPSLFSQFFIYAILIFWTLVVLFPIYWVFTTSIKLPIAVNSGPNFVPWVDFEPSMHAWQKIVVEEGPESTYGPFINTVVIGVGSAVLALAIGAAASYALVRFNYKPKLGLIGIFIGLLILSIVAWNFGVPLPLIIVSAIVIFFLLAQTVGKRFKAHLGNEDIAFWLISQRMLPPVAIVIPIFIFFKTINLDDTRISLIISYVAANLPIVVWLMRDYFANIPIVLEESAAIDGASRLRTFWSIVLPIAIPGLVATFLFVLVFTWNEYLLALFLSSDNAKTLPILVVAQNTTRGPQWWNMSVLIMMMIVPVIGMAIALERFIARGLLVGAVKS
ncbi:MAG: carbohydrate ABC transporter permease [Chloroflexota bacterium]